MFFFVWVGVALIFVNAVNGQQQQLQHQIIDVEWKFDHILILPVGCNWAKSLVWRISLKCAAGSFIMPTRLQASSNRTKFCGLPSRAPPHELYDGQTYSLQKKNPYHDPKQARRYSHEFFANGKLNRHDNPYFPIYNTSTMLWDCVGDAHSSENGCTFTVRASDFAEMEVNHASERKNNMSQLLMTLVLPGPYCSTADMFDHYDRDGGVVYKVARNSSGVYHLSSHTFERPPPPTPPPSSGSVTDALPIYDQSTSTEADFRLKQDKTTVALARNPRLHISEDVYLVIGPGKGTQPLDTCFLTLIPRDPALTRSLWLRDREKFTNSLLANFHVHFIQVTYNGYSTFYDDMTAIQHSHSWRNMFSVIDFNNATSAIKLAINFDLVRTVDQRKVRVGLALYEVMVVGDEHAALLQSSWPYRYMTSSREMHSRVILFRNVTVGQCTTPTYILPAAASGSDVIAAVKPPHLNRTESSSASSSGGQQGADQTGGHLAPSPTAMPPTPTPARPLHEKTVWPIFVPVAPDTTKRTTTARSVLHPPPTPTSHAWTAAGQGHNNNNGHSVVTTPSSLLSTSPGEVPARQPTLAPKVSDELSPIPAPSTPTSVVYETSAPIDDGGGGSTLYQLATLPSKQIGTKANNANSSTVITIVAPAIGGAGGHTTQSLNDTDATWGSFLENMWAWWIWAVIGTMVGIVVFATVGAFCFWDQGQSSMRPPAYQVNEDGDDPLLLSSFPPSWGYQQQWQQGPDTPPILPPLSSSPPSTTAHSTSFTAASTDNSATILEANTTQQPPPPPARSSFGLQLLAFRAINRGKRRPSKKLLDSSSSSSTSSSSSSSSPSQAAVITETNGDHHRHHYLPFSLYRRRKSSKSKQNQMSLTRQLLEPAPIRPSTAAREALSRCESVGDEKMREYLLLVAES